MTRCRVCMCLMLMRPMSKQALGQLNEWRRWAGEMPVSQLLYRLVFETDLSKGWQERAKEEPRMIRVFEDLQRWLKQMQDFENVANNSTLFEYSKLFPKPPKLETTAALGDVEG